MPRASCTRRPGDTASRRRGRGTPMLCAPTRAARWRFQRHRGRTGRARGGSAGSVEGLGPGSGTQVATRFPAAAAARQPPPPVRIPATQRSVKLDSYRFTHWNAFRAFFRPGFLRSTTLASRVNKPAAFSAGL